MNFLLDTHTFLWFVNGSPELNNHSRGLIEEFTNKRFLSIASLWEISIKVSLGKLKLSMPITELVSEHVYGNAIEILNISSEHLDVLRTLEFYHKDPFDRLLISQGIYEELPILSIDKAFDSYSVQRIWNVVQ